MFTESRRRIDGGWLAWFDAKERVLHIDPDLPERAVRRIREQTINKLLGNDHLAPDATTRPALRLIHGGADSASDHHPPLASSAG